VKVLCFLLLLLLFLRGLVFLSTNISNRLLLYSIEYIITKKITINLICALKLKSEVQQYFFLYLSNFPLAYGPLQTVQFVRQIVSEFLPLAEKIIYQCASTCVFDSPQGHLLLCLT